MRKISFEEARNKFIEKGRTDIELLEEGYTSFRNKAKFLDLLSGEVFEAIAKSVYYQDSSSPTRAKEERKQTNLKKYGNVCSVHGNTEAAMKVKKKIEDTCLRKHGVKTPASSEQTKTTRNNTIKEKYNVDNISQLRKKTVLETGEFVEDWLSKQPDPKPSSYQSFGAMFLFGLKSNNKQSFSIEELNLFLEKFREHKTKLEILGEQLFGLFHFNKKPHESLSYRPDFKLNGTIFCNVDGLYWHSEKQKDKKYHFEMRKKFEDNSLSIFQFREDEIVNRSKIIKSIISARLGQISQKVFARNCIVQNITQKEADKFLNQNHLMGTIKAKHLGLKNKKGETVSVMSYKTFNTGECKIERFCSNLDTVVVGGFSKLLSNIKKKEIDKIKEIHYWVDLRYGTGNHLRTFGFEPTKETLGWKWTDGINTFNRLQCRANMDDRNLSEKDHAAEKGWYRIYDAGQRLWVYSTNPSPPGVGLLSSRDIVTFF